MAKVYFPTYSRDLMINGGKQLQVQGSAGKVMSDCSVGDIIKLPETNGGVKAYQQYILCEKSDSYVVLLRKVAAAQGYHSVVDPNNWMYWCSNTFYNRFSDVAKAQMTTRNIDGTNRTAYLISTAEATTYFTDKNSRKAYNSGGTAIKWWLRNSSGQYCSYVDTDGSTASRQESDTLWYRPAIVFLPSAPINSDNEFEDEVVYTDTIETIKMGTDTYKIKDMDARTLIAGKQDTLPSGTNVGDTLVWDGSAWVVQPAT